MYVSVCLCVCHRVCEGGGGGWRVGVRVRVCCGKRVLKGQRQTPYYGVDGKRVLQGRWQTCILRGRWQTCGKGLGVGVDGIRVGRGGGGGVHVSTHLPEFLSSIMYLYMSRKALRAVTGQVL